MGRSCAPAVENKKKARLARRARGGITVGEVPLPLPVCCCRVRTGEPRIAWQYCKRGCQSAEWQKVRHNAHLQGFRPAARRHFAAVARGAVDDRRTASLPVGEMPDEPSRRKTGVRASRRCVARRHCALPIAHCRSAADRSAPWRAVPSMASLAGRHELPLFPMQHGLVAITVASGNEIAEVPFNRRQMGGWAGCRGGCGRHHARIRAAASGSMRIHEVRVAARGAITGRGKQRIFTMTPTATSNTAISRCESFMADPRRGVTRATLARIESISELPVDPPGSPRIPAPA